MSFVENSEEITREFQLGHFLAEMDSQYRGPGESELCQFQLGHFLAEMDRAAILGLLQLSK
jgi:hypothetical protein